MSVCYSFHVSNPIWKAGEMLLSPALPFPFLGSCDPLSHTHDVLCMGVADKTALMITWIVSIKQKSLCEVQRGRFNWQQNTSLAKDVCNYRNRPQYNICVTWNLLIYALHAPCAGAGCGLIHSYITKLRSPLLSYTSFLQEFRSPGMTEKCKITQTVNIF